MTPIPSSPAAAESQTPLEGFYPVRLYFVSEYNVNEKPKYARTVMIYLKNDDPESSCTVTVYRDFVIQVYWNEETNEFFGEVRYTDFDGRKNRPMLQKSKRGNQSVIAEHEVPNEKGQK